MQGSSLSFSRAQLTRPTYPGHHGKVLDRRPGPLGIATSTRLTQQSFTGRASAVKAKRQNRIINRKYSHASLTPKYAEASAKGLESRFGRDLGPKTTKKDGKLQTVSENGQGSSVCGVAGLIKSGLGGANGEAAGGS